MDTNDILSDARKTWGDTRMDLPHIALAAEVVAGDIARQARNHIEGQAVNEAELKKELGNLISSTIRWCDDLGYDPSECIRLSQQAQTAYKSRMP